jgi:hypothetical protein
VYAAARDLPAGTSLRSEDLVVLRVRLPATALRHYLRPSPDLQMSGRVLTAPVRRETLIPAAVVLASSRDADLVELPVQVDPGDMAQGLRPGDIVQVLAAYTEGARRGRAVVLLPAAEVIQVLQDPAGLAATGQERGVQLRMPSDRAPIVVAAIATARIFVVKAPGRPADATATEPGDPASAGSGSAGPGSESVGPEPADPGLVDPGLVDPGQSGSEEGDSDQGDPDSTGPPPTPPGPTPGDPAYPRYDDTEPASTGSRSAPAHPGNTDPGPTRIGPTDPDAAAPDQGEGSPLASLASRASSLASLASGASPPASLAPGASLLASLALRATSPAPLAAEGSG